MGRRQEITARFGLRVRELRKELGFSQEAFADRCGLDRTYVGGIERGERNVALRNIERIAVALGVSISDLTAGLYPSRRSAIKTAVAPQIDGRRVGPTRAAPCRVGTTPPSAKL